MLCGILCFSLIRPHITGLELPCSEICSSLNEILIPVLILCGEEDTVTPMAQAEFLNLNILNSEFCSIAKAGHLSNLEQPDEFNRYLTPFITKW